ELVNPEKESVPGPLTEKLPVPDPSLLHVEPDTVAQKSIKSPLLLNASTPGPLSPNVPVSGPRTGPAETNTGTSIRTAGISQRPRLRKPRVLKFMISSPLLLRRFDPG